MRKIMITSCMLAFAVLFCSHKANAQAYETSVEMKAGYKNAVTIDVPYNVDVAKETLKEHLISAGLKGKSTSKGFVEYKDVRFAPFGNFMMTIYTKVDVKGKKADNTSKIYVLVSLIEGEFCSSSSCEEVIERVKSFLEDFEPHVTLYNTSLEHERHQKELEKAEKSLRSLMSDSVKYQKEKDKILNKIEENSQEISSKEQEIEMKKKIIKEMFESIEDQKVDIRKLR